MTAAPKSWAAGVRAVHDQAAGAVRVEIIRPVDVLGLLSEALNGSIEAAQHLRLANEFIDKARRSSMSKPVLCGCCPRSIRRGPFSIALAIPARPDAQNVMALGICERCGTEPAELLERVRQALSRFWPDIREIKVHPAEGRA